MEDWQRKLISAIEDLDNHGYNDAPCTILFYLGDNDDGERYVDAQLVKGHIRIEDRHEYPDMAEFIGGEDLSEAVIELANDLS